MKNTNKNYFFNSSLMHSTIKVFLIGIMAIWFSHTAYSLNPDSLKMDVRPQISLLTEYDDNYNLINNSSADNIGEGMIHLLPRFGLSRNHKAHFYGLAFDSDFRKGMYSAPFKSNIQTSGQIKLKYNSGLEVSLSDYFMNSDFDLALTDLPEISQRQMNNFRSKVSYAITKKFKIYGSYDNRWNTYTRDLGKFKKLSNVFGGGLSYDFSQRVKLNVDYKNAQEKFTEYDSTRNRTLHDLNAKLLFPVTKSLSSYILYTFEKQDSPEIKYRNYTDNRTVGGLSWKGRNRLVIWAEAGYEAIVFESEFQQSYYNFVGIVGIDLKITEVLKTKLSAGVDGYSNFIFDGRLAYQYSNKTTVNLLASRKSQAYFYSYSPSAYYTAYNYQLNLSTVIKEHILFKIGGSLQTRDDFSDDFELPTAGQIYQTSKAFVVFNLKPSAKLNIVIDGSYLVMNSETNAVMSYQYDTWLGKFLINFAPSKRINLGAHYQYATRIATKDTYSYNNSRVGLYLKFLL